MAEKINAFFAGLADFSLHRLLPALLILVIGIFVVRIVLKLLSKALSKTKLENPALSLLMAVLKVVGYLLVMLITASSLGIDVTGIVALASVLTLAVSLSVQDSLTNLIGGFTLLYTKPFSIGDFAEISGQSGTVQQIGMTYTKMLTADGKTVSIPNSAVVSAQIVNYTVHGLRRVDVAINVSYSSDPEKVMDALKQAGKVSTALQEPAAYTAVTGYGDSTVGYILQVWCKTEDYWATLHAINQRIPEIFRQNGVIMTYPHLNIHLDK